jgi:hypothetical protein
MRSASRNIPTSTAWSVRSFSQLPSILAWPELQKSLIDRRTEPHLEQCHVLAEGIARLRQCSGMSPDAPVRRSGVRASMTEERPSIREAFRSLNRLPFVMGLLPLVAVGGLLVGLVTRTSVATTRAAVLGTAWMLLLGTLLIVLYYRLRE